MVREVFNFAARWLDSLFFTALAALFLALFGPTFWDPFVLIVGSVLSAVMIGTVWRLVERRP